MPHRGRFMLAPQRRRCRDSPGSIAGARGSLPATLRLARGETINQGYLALDGDTEVRLRTGSKPPKLTIKSGRGQVRTEVELPVEGGDAAALWELTDGRRLEKTRRVMRIDGVQAEVDEYAGDLAG